MFEATHVRKDVTFCAAVKLGIFVFLAQNKVQNPSAPAKKRTKQSLRSFFIQSEGLVWNLTAGEYVIAVGVWHHAIACIFPSD